MEFIVDHNRLGLFKIMTQNVRTFVTERFFGKKDLQHTSLIENLINPIKFSLNFREDGVYEGYV